MDGWNINWLQPSHHDTYTQCLQANDTEEEVLEATERGAAEY